MTHLEKNWPIFSVCRLQSVLGSIVFLLRLLYFDEREVFPADKARIFVNQ